MGEGLTHRVNPSPAPTNDFQFYFINLIKSKNSTVDGPVLVGGPFIGSDVRTSLQKVRTSLHLYTVEDSEVRTSEPADSPPPRAGPSACYFLELKKLME